MKIYKYISVAAIAGLLALPQVTTAAEEEKEKSAWKSQAELGVVVTNGNSKTSSTNAKLDTTYEKETWRHNVHAEAYSASTDLGQSAERYQLSEKTDYKFNEHDYAFGLINYDHDVFSGFEHQTTAAVGYGRRVMNRDTMTLDFEVGPGVRYFKIQEDVETKSEGVVRLAAKYFWQVSENAKFTQDLYSDIGEDLTVSKSITSLQANINTSLAMKFTVTAKHNSEVPLGTKKTDTETALTLVYSF